MTTFTESVKFNAGVDLSAATVLGGLARAQFQEDSLQKYGIPWNSWRVHDAVHTNLPTIGANDDLGLAGNTFGTNSFWLTTEDLQSAGSTTEYARTSFHMPPEYVDAGTVTLRITCGMVTTVADSTATVNAECYSNDGDGTVTGDLVETAATTCNSLTAAAKDFTITPTNLTKASELDIRVSLTVNDAAGVTAVFGRIFLVQLLLDIRG